MTKKDGLPSVAKTKFEFGFRLIGIPKMCANCAHRDYACCGLSPQDFTIGKLDNHVCDRWKRSHLN
jgi:hypothetical protein